MRSGEQRTAQDAAAHQRIDGDQDQLAVIQPHALRRLESSERTRHQRIALDTGVVHQQVWVLQGTIEVTLGDERHELDAGDCLAMVLDKPITYRNPTSKPARYAVVIVSTAQ